MISHATIPQTTNQLESILLQLKASPHVEEVVLVTEDGLMIHGISTQPTQLAATAGFIMTTARQSCVLLGMDGCQEVKIYTAKRRLLVSYVFQVGLTRLLLVLSLQKEVQMKRIILQTIAAIQQLMEV